MSTVTSRKKSIISTAGLSIETPNMQNTLLNKAASQSTSLYQQCSALRARLMRIHDFPQFFALSSSQESSRQSTDPVTQLWDCFALGTPLCYIFNLLPRPVEPIEVNTDPTQVDVTNDKAMKHAIIKFAMGIKQFDQCEQFTVMDLWNRNSTDGFVKVVNTVTLLVDRLPEAVFVSAGPSSPSIVSSQDSSDTLVNPDSPVLQPPVNAQEAARHNIIREMVETERKYVQDLEVMQKYATALSQSNTIDQDTIHLLFPNLNKLLNFQRKFLIRLESTAESAWKDQRWGLLFTENEDEFAVYEPYCANYTNAAELMIAEEQNLMTHSHLINAKSELPAFLIKPVQRICKYPLLLDSLIKASSPVDYPYYAELQAGTATAKRITDKINEAQRRAENVQTVKGLAARVEDWKGHHLSNFGDLLLDDVFVVTKSDVDREYHVFLFEKIILCCKEALVLPNSAKKVGKTNSILKKQQAYPSTSPGGPGRSKNKNTPLLLKGRIFLNNVTQAVPNVFGGQYALAVWWRGDDDLEYFTLRCRTEEQLRQWEAQINRLIQETARRASERGMTAFATQLVNTPSRIPQTRSAATYNHEKTISQVSQYQNIPVAPRFAGSYYPTPYSSDEHIPLSKPSSVYGVVNNANGRAYTSSEGTTGFEADDDFEDYPPASYPSSGRGTPMGTRRGNVAQSLPPEQRETSYYDRPGGRSEDANGAVLSQWRANGHAMPPPPPPPVGVLPIPPGALRPGPSPRSNSNASDASFGNGVPPAGRGLRSQFSSTKLKNTYENTDPRANGIPAHPYAQNQNGVPGPLRSRSISNPSPLAPRKEPPPPLPTATPWTDRSRSQMSQHKRGSGSSQSTGDSSEFSPQGSSPTTFGSSDSTGSLHPYGQRNSAEPPVKVKVHFFEDIFVIQVPRATEYNDLVERVGKKIRLCGPRRDDGPLRVKYKDEDGDMVSVGSTEDVQMAFDSVRPGGQVTLFVT